MTPNHAKLLVVDDSKAVRQMIRDLMVEFGFRAIDEAPDGLVALDLFQSAPYDLVITDWNMPFVSGLELVRLIRQAPQRATTPVLLFSGEVSPKRVAEALQCGADAFVTKPFVTETLREQVLRLVSAQRPARDFIPTPRPFRAVRRRP